MFHRPPSFSRNWVNAPGRSGNSNRQSRSWRTSGARPPTARAVAYLSERLGVPPSELGDPRTNNEQLVYTRFVDGAWSAPAQVAPDPNAGHQMLASLAIDKKDGLHVVWRDQRFVSPEARLALPTNADILGSDYVNGAWTTPVQINTREAPDVNPAWPHLAVDNDRLVLVWSIYKGTTADEMRSAARVEWSTRALDASAKWTTPQVLFERQSG